MESITCPPPAVLHPAHLLLAERPWPPVPVGCKAQLRLLATAAVVVTQGGAAPAAAAAALVLLRVDDALCCVFGVGWGRERL